MDNTLEDFITAEEVAIITGHTVRALQMLRNKKEKFPYYKCGKMVYYKKSEIYKIIEAGRVGVKEENEQR